jgi:rod shape-determining protein MreD
VKRVVFWVVVAVVMLAQISLLPGLRPFGVVPSAALVLVVLVGVESTASLAIVVAVAGGLVLDLTSGVNIGLWTGVLVLAALVTGFLHRAGVEMDSPVVPGVVVAAGTLLAAVVVLAGLVNVTAHWPAGFLVSRVGLELMLNLILMILLRPVVRRIVPVRASDGAVIG